MPKGVGTLVAILVVLVAGIGVAVWIDKADPFANRKSKTVSATLSADSQQLKSPAQNTQSKAAGGGRFPGGVVPEDDFEAGQLVVLDPPEGFADAVRGMGFTVLEVVDLSDLSTRLYRLRVPPGRSVGEGRIALAGAFPGLIVDANHNFSAQAASNFKNNVARAAIGWKISDASCGQGLVIGMIDASVEVKHPALAGQDVEFKSFHAETRRAGPADHGTAVAAIFVGKPEWGGLVPGAALKAANMFERNETGRVVGNAVALLKSINWLAGKNVHVVNMSVAGSDNKAVRVAIDKAQRKRLVIIAAAGNWGGEDKPAFPAAYKDVIAVTAISQDKAIYDSANRGTYVEFAAPGVSIYTAVPSGGRLQSGTSFAAPYLSVLMAVAISNGEKKNPDSLRIVMQKGIQDLGSPGKDNTFGWGLVSGQPGC